METRTQMWARSATLRVLALMTTAAAWTAAAQAPLAETAAPATATDAGSATEPMSYDKARRTAEASLRLHPGSDSRYDYRPLWAGSADLDRDGRPEIVYLYTATQNGGGQQLNELVVMTALADADPRAQSPAPGKNVYDDETYALIRASGHADDAQIHVPGEVEDVALQDGRISVTFSSAKPSRLCGSGKGAMACPAEGRHVWTYVWSPGKLTRSE